MRWVATDNPDAFLAEISYSDASLSLREDAANVGERCVALIVNFDVRNQAGLDVVAREKLFKAKLPLPICLTIRGSMLAQVRVPSFAAQQLQLLLDGVDESTPLHQVSSEKIAAIRVAEGLSVRSKESLRSDCVLDSILKLARNLGLCTLGHVSRQREAVPFDYVRPRGAEAERCPTTKRRSTRTRQASENTRGSGLELHLIAQRFR